MLIRRPAWTRQPQAAGVNWGHPLSRGLKLAWLPRMAEDPITGLPWTYQRGFRPGRGGIATDAAASGYNYLPPPANSSAYAAQLFDVSVLTAAVVALQTTATNDAYQFIRGNGSSAPLWGIGLHGGSFAGPRGYIGSWTYSPGTADSTMVGNVHVCAISGDGSNGEIWYDGRLISSSAYTPGTAQYDTANYRAVIVGSNGLGTGNSTETYAAFFWDRQLSAIEQRAFAANPWQLFEPRQIIVPLSVGSSFPILSASTYKPATLTTTGWTPRVTAT